MQRIKNTIYLLILSIFALSLASCSSSRAPATTAFSWPDFSLPNDMQPPVEHPNKVVLMLPLHGKLGGTGQAIRNGFLAAYYYDRKHTERTAPNVTVVDTSNGDVQALYQQTVNQGVQFIVGPLTKANVQAVANLGQLSVPTLALNTLDNMNYTVTDLYQFGLSPIDEAVQIAQKARQDGHQNALIITPAGSWGQNISTAFSNRWQALGGKVVGNVAYKNRKALAVDIRNLLNINQSDERAGELKSLLKEKIRFVPRRRKDADMIFIAALPEQARTIRPLLKFYYAGNIPVYAISSIYNGIPSPARDRDLNGIEFCDMPWVLYGNHQLTLKLENIRKRIMTLWPDSYNRYPKLYALGIDAYMLVSDLHELVTTPNVGVPGASGMLYIHGNLKIFRQCAFAKFKHGKPQLLS